MNYDSPAFPRPWTGPSENNGMSLRDYFAAAAIAAALSSFQMNEPSDYTDAAEIAYQMADAMLKEREKKND